MPSVLVELGYLSNAKDEAQLLDPDWRDKAADRIAAAIALFAAAKTGGRRLTSAVVGTSPSIVANRPQFVVIMPD